MKAKDCANQMLTVTAKTYRIPIAYQMIRKINSILLTTFEMGTIEFFLFPPDEKIKSPEMKGYAQGHKSIKLGFQSGQPCP